MLRTTFLAAAALALGACATNTCGAEARAERDCFRSLDVSGYSVVDDHRVSLRVSPQREYILTIAQQTRDLDWSRAISVRSVTSFICVGDPSGVRLMGGDPPFPYHVTAIERAPRDTAVEGS